MRRSNMPELPEVETVKNHLNKIIKNKVINDVLILRHSIIDGDEKEFVKALKGQKIIDVKRRGKFLIFNLTGSHVLISHLRMEGKYIKGKNINDKSKYARIIFVFKDKSILNYDDSRTFGRMIIKNKENYLQLPPLSLLGQEAIDDINVNKFYSLIHNDRRYIKEVLLDQNVISGLGNIYVDETLFASKISPLSQACCLNKNDIKNILNNAKKILLKAIKNNGTTVHTFTWDAGKSGNFQSLLKVYGKKGKLCPNCDKPFVKIKLKGRGTTYCPHCQKLKNNKYVLGVTGPVSSGKTTALKELEKSGFKTFSCDEEVAKLYCDKNFLKLMVKKLNIHSKDEAREIASKNKEKLKQIEALIHPIIKEKLKDFIKKNDGNLAIEVPLLFQTGMDKMMNETLLILPSENDKWIRKRGNKGNKQLTINNNVNYDSFAKRATYVIYNNASVEALKKKIKQVCR